MGKFSKYPRFIWVIRVHQFLGTLIFFGAITATIYLAYADGGIPFSGDYPATWISSIRSAGIGLAMVVVPWLMLSRAPHLIFGTNLDENAK